MDAAEYKHVVLGLIFLKYISDAFEERHVRLVAEQASGADPEDPDEYRAESIFCVPPEARWPHLKAQARQSTVGRILLALPIVLPPEEVQARLAAPLRALNDRIALARRESRTLAALRDTLFPKLISGELRVRDAERFLDTASA